MAELTSLLVAHWIYLEAIWHFRLLSTGTDSSNSNSSIKSKWITAALALAAT